MTRFDPADARVIGALMQLRRRHGDLPHLLEGHVIGARMHATLPLIGLVTTRAARPAAAQTARAAASSPATASVGAGPS